MKLIDFWECLPGVWRFSREISNGMHQSGTLSVTKTSDLHQYMAFEQGTYINNFEQTFFRKYFFCLKNNVWHICGFNPKNGYVALHEISDNAHSHKHQCVNDSYFFELLNISKNSWKTSITVLGPFKNFKIITEYKLTEI